ncbi:MAG: hypothetical protein ACYDCL_10170 [Myxococcales bacterium]
MRRTTFTAAIGLYLAVAAAAVWEARRPTVALAKEDDAPMAPELGGGLAWINTDHPLRLADLRGQAVILDFWTYG